MKNCATLVLFTVLSFHSLMGQFQITDLSTPAGDNPSYPSGFITYSNLLLFSARTASEGSEIWIRNENETYRLKDIYPGIGNGANDLSVSSAELKGKLVFTANDGEHGTQLWETDGTASGTQRITNIGGLDGDTRLTLVGEYIFFLARSGNKLEVWKSDGTAAGTVQVKGAVGQWNAPSYENAALGLFFFSFQDE